MAFNRSNNGLGNLFGPTMGQGLQSLVSQNLENMMEQKGINQTSNGLQALGFNPQEANAMSGNNAGMLQDLMQMQQQSQQQPMQPQEEPRVSASKRRAKSPTTKGSVQEETKSVPEPTPVEKRTPLDPVVAEDKKDRDYYNKETRELYDKVNSEYSAAKSNDKRLDRIEDLTKKGNLGSPVLNSLVKTMGKGISLLGLSLDLPGLMTADAQELDKLSNDFIRDAKGIFGNKLTDADLYAFLRIIPTLAQSNRGRLRIIHNMKEMNEASKVKKKAMDKIIKENRGHRPLNLGELIDDRTGDEIEKIAQSFKAKRGNDQSKSFSEAVSNIGEGWLHY